MKKEKKEDVEQKTSKLAIVSFVLGCFSLATLYPLILVLFSLLGFISKTIINKPNEIMIFIVRPLIFIICLSLSTRALKDIKQNLKLKGKLLAILGIIFSFLALVIIGILIPLTWGTAIT